jgi:hypothetical protein
MPTLRHSRHRSLPAPFWPGESILLARPAVMAIAHLRRDPVTSSGRVTFPEVRGALMVILETILHDAHATGFKHTLGSDAA